MPKKKNKHYKPQMHTNSKGIVSTWQSGYSQGLCDGQVIMADVITDGLKHDGGKPRLDLVPPEIIEAVGAVMTHGAEKYGEASYKNVDPKRYRSALMRHICKWLKEPHGTDEDSGLPHLWHIACNVAFLLELDKG